MHYGRVTRKKTWLYYTFYEAGQQIHYWNSPCCEKVMRQVLESKNTLDNVYYYYLADSIYYLLICSLGSISIH